MSLKKKIMSAVARRITDEGAQARARAAVEKERLRAGAPHRVTFYYQPDDPYSHLLAQILPDFVARYGVTLECRVVPAPVKAAAPELDMLEAYAIRDGAELAARYGLEFPAKARRPNGEATKRAASIVLAVEGGERVLDAARAVGRALWSGKSLAAAEISFGAVEAGEAARRLAANQAERAKRGHYLGATLYYGGEWYWGLDRLGWLESRLRALGVGDGGGPVLAPLSGRIKSIGGGKKKPSTVDFYFSFRSPYSYLAAERVFALADRYPVSVNVKPVLPMVMRGLLVPRAKRMYILRDAKREASANDIPFGNIVDPLGPGILRCMALLADAETQGKAREFLTSVTRGVWSEAIDVAGDRGLRVLAERAGLDWTEARGHLNDTGWRDAAERNRRDLFDLGLWGVPSFRFGETSIWGQDRLWLLEENIAATVGASPSDDPS